MYLDRYNSLPGSTKSIPDYNLPMSLSGQSLDIRLLVDRIPAFTWSTHPDGSVEFGRINDGVNTQVFLLKNRKVGAGRAAIHPEDFIVINGEMAGAVAVRRTG